MLSQLSRSWGTGSEKNLIAQLVSRLSLSEKYGSGRTIATVEIRVVRLGSFQNLYLSFAIVEITHGVTANRDDTDFHHAKPQILYDDYYYLRARLPLQADRHYRQVTIMSMYRYTTSCIQGIRHKMVNRKLCFLHSIHSHSYLSQLFIIHVGIVISFVGFLCLDVFDM